MLAVIFAARRSSRTQIAPYRYDEIDLEALYSPPHFETWNLLSPKNHLFGTDLLGRDYFSRVIYGIRTSALGRALVAVLSTVIGTDRSARSPATSAASATTCSCGSPTSS